MHSHQAPNVGILQGDMLLMKQSGWDRANLDLEEGISDATNIMLVFMYADEQRPKDLAQQGHLQHCLTFQTGIGGALSATPQSSCCRHALSSPTQLCQAVT